MRNEDTKQFNYRRGAIKRLLGIKAGEEVQPGDLISKARNLEEKDVVPAMEQRERIALMGG